MQMNFCPNPDGPVNYMGSDTCALYKVMTKKTTRAKMTPNDKDGNDNERKKVRKNDESKMKSVR